jgi:hypothetical protein
MRFSGPDDHDRTMSPRDVPVDELVGRALVKDAAELAANLPLLDPADRRTQRALDRWFCSWSEQLRTYFDAVSSILVPVATGRGVVDEQWCETIADDLAAIDELVSALGDAIGIVAMELGDRDVWLGRASVLADQLASFVRNQVSQHRRIATLTRAHLSAEERRAVNETTVRWLGSWQARRTVPSLLGQLEPDERDAVLAAAPVTTSWWWRVGRGHRMSAVPAPTSN